jgi:hypothetical protein
MSSVLNIDFENSSSNFREHRNPDLISETLALVGPSYKGPAFVPIIVNEYSESEPDPTLNTFENIFGAESKNYYATPTIANIWLTSGGQQLSYTRILGIGDGSGTEEVSGITNGSGFVVGEKTVCDSIIPGKVGDNNKAQRSGLAQGEELALGRTFFYCNRYFNQIIPNKIFSSYESNMYGNLNTNEHFYLIDKVFLTQQGVYLTLDRKQNSTIDTLLTTMFNTHTRNSDLKGLTVKSDTDYGTTANDFFGGFITFKDGDDSLDRICINGLNNEEYSRISNILKFENKDTSNYINYYNDDIGTSINFINKDFKRLNDRGYLEYCNFKFEDESLRHVSGANNQAQIILPSRLAHNIASKDEGIPSYEDFQSTFKKAKTPWVVSQHLYGWAESDDTVREDIDKKCTDLFRFHACDDGEIGNRFRIRIKPKKLGKDSGIPDFFNSEKNKIVSKNTWSTFDISIKEYNNKINSFTEIMNVSNVDLNPDSQNYICRLFGTRNTYFDLENKKIVDVGFYPKTNQYLFVEVHPDVEDKINSCTLMPSGFHSYPHININNNCLVDETLLSKITTDTSDLSGKIRDKKIFQKPVNYNRNLNYTTRTGTIEGIEDEQYYWGVQFNNQTSSSSSAGFNFSFEGEDKIIPLFTFNYPKYLQDSVNFATGNNMLSPYYDYTKWFQDSRSDINVWVEDKNYLNSFFHLEKILYIKNADLLGSKYRFASYRRDGKSIADIKFENGNDEDRNEIIDIFKYVNINDLLIVNDGELESENSKFLKFDFFTYGGFDGLNCFDYDKKLMNNDAVVRELEDEDSDSLYQGPTYNMYSKALGITTQYENTDCDILSIPGITHPKFLREIHDITEEKDRFISIIDVPKLDSSSNFITGSMFEESYISNENDAIQAINPPVTNTIAGDIIIKKINSGINDVNGNPIFTNFNEINEEGTIPSLNFFNKFNFESRNMFAMFNDVIVSEVGSEDKYKINFVLPSTSLAINALSKTYNSPQINLDNKVSDIYTNEYFTFFDGVNNNFIGTSNEKPQFLRLSESIGVNIVGAEAENTQANLSINSANSLKEDRRSIFRSINNTRILNRIKKSIKFNLYGYNRRDPLLFNNIFSKSSINTNFKIVLEETLQEFIEDQSLRGFKVDMGTSLFDSLVSNKKNEISCKVLISFFGQSINGNLTNISLDNIMSNIDQLIENFNENIVIVRT